jgi:hypothetical protein
MMLLVSSVFVVASPWPPGSVKASYDVGLSIEATAVNYEFNIGTVTPIQMCAAPEGVFLISVPETGRFVEQNVILVPSRRADVQSCYDLYGLSNSKLEFTYKLSLLLPPVRADKLLMVCRSNSHLTPLYNSPDLNRTFTLLYTCFQPFA